MPEFRFAYFRTWSLSNAIISLITIALLNCLVKGWIARSYARRLRRSGLPMPPHSLLLGHLGIHASIFQSLPGDAHGHYLADQIRRKYPELGPVFYLDLWPFTDLMLMVTDPAVISQFCHADHLLPKHPGMKRFLLPITDGYDLNCLEGDTWKRWRRLFNPGFSPSHTLNLVPSIVEDVLIFRDDLIRRAREGKMFKFEDHALKLTLDVIGKVSLDSKFNTQRGFNPMTTALLDQRKWAAFGLESDFLTIMNPLRYPNIWKNRKIMNDYINHELESRYLTALDPPNSKTIIDLALKDYDTESMSSLRNREPLDETFKKYARAQLKVFIFAGHDAVSTAICYAWLLLSRNPRTLEKLRAEHDAVLGPTKEAAEALIQDPALLNQLHYTLAVIKEAMRLFPAVSSPRKGQPNFLLADSQGRQFPTEGCLVWANHHGVHNNPLFWRQADEFLPERFLQDVGDELRPVKDAWRPFERGPRACIGSELAYAEIKTVFALTARDFDLEEAYAEWDRENGTKGIKTVNRERAYQIQLGSAHPADGFPVRIKLRGT
ncbi:cytochrome P450 monooxygenase-like protein [Lophiostoma macrostomum CBS 122681]|uniref:Cytochrome P450 monooxygenase-like protein n=1 Tax=Lophiostoma macrostomum CBS 122681 TaxID=1314788 RepID=A0A6A6TR77_9PLEO|nr:cytochrome P450 monooxygenase-like protein [Lophiostoma macrostomum CBS 122681]